MNFAISLQTLKQQREKNYKLDFHIDWRVWREHPYDLHSIICHSACVHSINSQDEWEEQLSLQSFDFAHSPLLFSLFIQTTQASELGYCDFSIQCFDFPSKSLRFFTSKVHKLLLTRSQLSTLNNLQPVQTFVFRRWNPKEPYFDVFPCSAQEMSAPAINMRFSIPPTLTAAGKSTQTHFQSQPCRPSSNMKWTEQKIFISRIFKLSARLKIFIFFENIFPSFKNSISLSRSDRFIISTESTSFQTRFFSTFHLTKNILFWPSLLY